MDKQENTENVKDNFFMTYILFYAWGTISLIPSYFFTTATDYWMYKFRDPQSNVSYDSNNRTSLQVQFTADFSIATNVSSAIFIVVTVFFLKKLKTQIKITASLAGGLLLFAITCIFVKVDTDPWQMGFMVTNLITGCLLTGCSSTLLVTVFQVGPQFPPNYLAAVLVGQALCGLLAAVAQIISLSVNEDPEVQGMVYFGFALAFAAFTFISYLGCLKKSQFFKHHFKKEMKEEKFDINSKNIILIVNKIKYYILTMFISNGSTVMIHPSVTSLVVSVNKDDDDQWSSVYFRPVITFFIQCLIDVIGRQTAGILKKPTNGLILLGVSCIRVALVPMIMLCNAQPRNHMPVVFNEDYDYIIFIIILAFTHGYILNISVYCMSTIPTDEEKPLAMLIISLFMIVSMAACSFVGRALVQAL